MTKIAVVGITADPPTHGHALLAQAAYFSKDEKRKQEYDEIWLMPCNNHKYGKKTVEAYHRLAMTSLLTASLNSDFGDVFKVSDFEIRLNLDGSAWSTFCNLQVEYPSNEFHWVIGMDNANEIDRWHNAQALKELLPFRVLQRRGVTPASEDAWYNQPPHKLLKYNCSMECASSDFRRLYRSGDIAAKKYVYPSIYHYIKHTGIYREDS